MTSHLGDKRNICKIIIRRTAWVREYGGRANFCSNLLSSTNWLQISMPIFGPIFEVIKPLHHQFCAVSSIQSLHILDVLSCKRLHFKIYLEEPLYSSLTLCAGCEFEFVNQMFGQKAAALRFLQLISCSRSSSRGARKTASHCCHLVGHKDDFP